MKMRSRYAKSRRIRFAEDPVWYICPGCHTQYSNSTGQCPVCGRKNG